MVSCYPRCSRTPHNGYVANSMRGTIRSFLLFEAATFLVAFLIHSGVLIAGYEHQKARIAEGVIALVLLTAAISTWIRPASTRTAGLAGQSIRPSRHADRRIHDYRRVAEITPGDRRKSNVTFR